MADAQSITANQSLVIRKPVSEVFGAFADPEVTTRFWFGRSSGPLASGANVEWHFDPHGVSAAVRVLAFEPAARIVFEWGNPDGSDVSTVDMTFEPRPDDRTFVRIVNSGFAGDPNEVIAKALDSMGGFSMVLVAAKAWLEHQVELAIVADKL